jgi:hypothetical protein
LGMGQREYDQVAAVMGADSSDQGSGGGLGGRVGKTVGGYAVWCC